MFNLARTQWGETPWRGKDGLEGRDKEGVRKAALSARWQGTLLPPAAESPARPPIAYVATTGCCAAIQVLGNPARKDTS